MLQAPRALTIVGMLGYKVVHECTLTIWAFNIIDLNKILQPYSGTDWNPKSTRPCSIFEVQEIFFKEKKTEWREWVCSVGM